MGRLSKSILFFALSLLISGCYQAEVGCLDIEAKNFNLAADENCGANDTNNGCPCTYPILSSLVEYGYTPLVMPVVDTFLEYERDTFYQVGIPNQYIRIKSIRFYLSDFRLLRSNGESSEVEDTINLTVLNEDNQVVTNVFKDDFLLISQQSSINIGMIRQSAQFDSICFLVGIEGAANTVDPSTITTNSHPLGEETMHFGNSSEGYIFNQIILTKDTITTEETVFNIGGNTNLVRIKLPFSHKSSPGIDFSLGTLRINQTKWFDGINFATDTDNAMITKKIVANTPLVFSISN